LLKYSSASEGKFPSIYSFQLDGQNRNLYNVGLIDAEELLSIERVIEEWSVWKDLLDKGELGECQDGRSEPDKGIKSHWWNSKWIPITWDGSGNHFGIKSYFVHFFLSKTKILTNLTWFWYRNIYRSNFNPISQSTERRLNCFFITHN